MVLIQLYVEEETDHVSAGTRKQREHNWLISKANVLILSDTDEELSTTKNVNGKKGV